MDKPIPEPDDLMTAPNRCEPPEGLRGVAGWHWLTCKGEPYHAPMRWEPDPPHWPEKSGAWCSQPIKGRGGWAAERGWAYLGPVPAHSDLVRLTEAALAVIEWADECRLTTNDPEARELMECLTSALAPLNQEIAL
jgi:hypothetical protein